MINNMNFLETKNITKSYNNLNTIEDISINIKKGELVSLIGTSGVGKTTLFNILSGIDKPDSGEIFLEGENITGKTGKLSYMQQKDLLLPFRTTIDNVIIPLKLKGIPYEKALETARKYMDEFGLSGSEKKYPNQISGGMRQRAAFLRAYLYSDKFMLLDEPFSALDSITKLNLHKWYKDISKAHNTTTFYITHDIDEAIFLSDRIYIMTGPPGKITFEKTVKKYSKDFYNSEEYMKLKQLLIEHINLT